MGDADGSHGLFTAKVINLFYRFALSPYKLGNINCTAKNKKQLTALTAIMKALKVDFKTEEGISTYSDEFIAKMEKSEQDVKAGKTIKI